MILVVVVSRRRLKRRSNIFELFPLFFDWMLEEDRVVFDGCVPVEFILKIPEDQQQQASSLSLFPAFVKNYSWKYYKMEKIFVCEDHHLLNINHLYCLQDASA